MPSYRERLWPAWWVTLLVIATVLMLAVAYGAAIAPAVGWLVAVVGALAAGLIIGLTSPVIHVSDRGLRWAQLTVPHHALGEVSLPTADEVRHIMALRHRDVRPFLAVRNWATQRTILASLTDPTDPHTHILVSTRHPQELVAILAQYRTRWPT